MYSFEVSPEEITEKLYAPLYRSKHILKDFAEKGSVEVSELDELVEIASGTYVDRYIKNGTTYLRVDNIREFITALNQEDIEFVSLDSNGITERVITKELDVLIARTGTLGKAAVCFGPTVGNVLSQHLTRLTIKDFNTILPGYLAAYLNSDFGKYQLLYSGYGSTRKELTHSALRTVKIIRADYDVQKEIHSKITDALNTYYESREEFATLISQFEKLINVLDRPLPEAKLFEIKPTNLDSLWTPRFYRPMHVELQSRLVKNYSCKKLGLIAHIQRGKGTRVTDYATNGIPFVRTTSLINYGIDPFPDHYASDDIHELFRQPIQEGDVLYSMEGKIGQVAFLTSEDTCVFKNHIELVRCKSDYDPMYIFFCLSSQIGKLQGLKNTVVQATIPGMASRLRDFLIPIAPLEQNESRDYLDRLKPLLKLGYRAAAKRAKAIAEFRDVKLQLEHYFESIAQ